jgi:hypothetical protein
VYWLQNERRFNLGLDYRHRINYQSPQDTLFSNIPSNF